MPLFPLAPLVTIARSAVPSVIGQNQYFWRVDHNFSGYDRVFVRYAADRSTLDDNYINPVTSGGGYKFNYFMVVNGLTDPTGTAADCRQEIKLDFANSPPASAVFLDPETGLLQTNIMADVSGKKRLVIDLDGGDALYQHPNPSIGIRQADPRRRRAA